MTESPFHGRRISVFGSSRLHPESSTYRNCLVLGRLLAEQGFVVCNGGYGGVMEAISRGAHEANGQVLGVTLELFTARAPNTWLSEEKRVTTLFHRLEHLITGSDGFIVANGGSGTLTELTLVWNMHLSGIARLRPIILLGQHWQPLLDAMVAHIEVLPEDLAPLTVVATPEEAVQSLCWQLDRLERLPQEPSPPRKQG